MPQTSKILCDNCGTDISSTAQMIQYRLVLSSETRPQRPDVEITQQIDEPEVPQQMFFCNLTCAATKSAAMLAAEQSH